MELKALRIVNFGLRIREGMGMGKIIILDS
jgi:hypothetical protein